MSLNAYPAALEKAADALLAARRLANEIEVLSTQLRDKIAEFESTAQDIVGIPADDRPLLIKVYDRVQDLRFTLNAKCAPSFFVITVGNAIDQAWKALP